jgi:hypothetical protein
MPNYTLTSSHRKRLTETSDRFDAEQSPKRRHFQESAKEVLATLNVNSPDNGGD